MKTKLTLIFLIIGYFAANAQNDTIVYLKGHKIHPNKFTTLSSEKITNDSVYSTQVFKSNNHKYFGICTFNKNTKDIQIDLLKSNGETNYSFKIMNLKSYSLYNCTISPDGDLVNCVFIIPMIEEQGYLIQSYSKGKLIFTKDSISSYHFNLNNSILTYFRTNNLGLLYYKDLKLCIEWNLKVSNELIYTGFVSKNGKSIIVHSLNSFIGVNNKGDILWTKEKSYFKGNIGLSDLGEHVIVSESSETKLYNFNTLKLFFAYKQVDNYGFAFCQDDKKLVYIPTAESINVYDFSGKFIKSLNVKAQWFEVEDANDSIDIHIERAKHIKFKK